MTELDLTEITAALKKEISIITGKKAEDLKETESLSFNGITSLMPLMSITASTAIAVHTATKMPRTG